MRWGDKNEADQEPQIRWTRNSQGIGSQRALKSPAQSWSKTWPWKWQWNEYYWRQETDRRFKNEEDKFKPKMTKVRNSPSIWFYLRLWNKSKDLGTANPPIPWSRYTESKEETGRRESQVDRKKLSRQSFVWSYAPLLKPTWTLRFEWGCFGFVPLSVSWSKNQPE